MGLLDLPSPLLAAVDITLASFLPAAVRLVLWGVLAGWLTMFLYRRWSRQEAIAGLKQHQRKLQEDIARFEGEFKELWPMVKNSLALGFRQLGLSIGPALLATIPVIFLVVWVAGTYSFAQPEQGAQIRVAAEPTPEGLLWKPESAAVRQEGDWIVTWPEPGETVSLQVDDHDAVTLGDGELFSVIHKWRWWNFLMANPAGYFPAEVPTETVRFELPARTFLPFGPRWMRGWMFLFFAAFLLSSLAFKFWLKID